MSYTSEYVIEMQEKEANDSNSDHDYAYELYLRQQETNLNLRKYSRAGEKNSSLKHQRLRRPCKSWCRG